jgi:hypothetical protein
MGGVCSTHGGNEKCVKIFVGKPEWKRLLGRPRHRWMDNIKISLSEIGFVGVDWIHLALDSDQWQALVNMVVNLQIP